MGEDGRVAVPTGGDSRACLGGAPCSRPSVRARGGHPMEAAVTVVLPRPFAVAAESGAGLGVGLELCVPNLGGLRTILGISCLSSRPRTCVVGMWCVSKELLRGQAGAQGQLVGCPLQT